MTEAQALLQEGLAAFKARAYQDAIRAWRALLKLEPDHVQVQDLVARTEALAAEGQVVNQLREELTDLREELAATRESRNELLLEMARIHRRYEEREARLWRAQEAREWELRESLANVELQQIQGVSPEQEVEVNALQMQIRVLREELANAHVRIVELEEIAGEHAYSYSEFDPPQPSDQGFDLFAVSEDEGSEDEASEGMIPFAGGEVADEVADEWTVESSTATTGIAAEINEESAGTESLESKLSEENWEVNNEEPVSSDVETTLALSSENESDASDTIRDVAVEEEASAEEKGLVVESPFDDLFAADTASTSGAVQEESGDGDVVESLFDFGVSESSEVPSLLQGNAEFGEREFDEANALLPDVVNGESQSVDAGVDSEDIALFPSADVLQSDTGSTDGDQDAFVSPLIDVEHLPSSSNDEIRPTTTSSRPMGSTNDWPPNIFDNEPLQEPDRFTKRLGKAPLSEAVQEDEGIPASMDALVAAIHETVPGGVLSGVVDERSSADSTDDQSTDLSSVDGDDSIVPESTAIALEAAETSGIEAGVTEEPEPLFSFEEELQAPVPAEVSATSVEGQSAVSQSIERHSDTAEYTDDTLNDESLIEGFSDGLASALGDTPDPPRVETGMVPILPEISFDLEEDEDIYVHELHGKSSWIPVRVKRPEDISPIASYLMSHIDGVSSFADLRGTVGLPPEAVDKGFLELINAGALRARRPS